MHNQLIENDEFHQFMEYSWKRTFISLMRPVIVEEIINNPDFTFSKTHPNFVKQEYSKITDLTLIDPFRLGTLIDIVDQIKSLEGDIVECGSFKGGSGILMGLFLKKHGIAKKIHLFDSFEGLPEPDKSWDKGYKKGQFVSNYDELLAHIEKNDLGDIIEIHRGWFKDSIPPFLKENPELKISLLHVDCDLYNSTNDCFPDLYPHVVAKGVVALDDFNDGGRGEKIAILEEIKAKKEKIYVGPAPQTYFIKQGDSTQEEKVITDFGFDYSFDILLANKAYIQWLNETMQDDFENKMNQFLEVIKK